MFCTFSPRNCIRFWCALLVLLRRTLRLKPNIRSATYTAELHINIQADENCSTKMHERKTFKTTQKILSSSNTKTNRVLHLNARYSQVQNHIFWLYWPKSNGLVIQVRYSKCRPPFRNNQINGHGKHVYYMLLKRCCQCQACVILNIVLPDASCISQASGRWSNRKLYLAFQNDSRVSIRDQRRFVSLRTGVVGRWYVGRRRLRLWSQCE